MVAYVVIVASSPRTAREVTTVGVDPTSRLDDPLTPREEEVECRENVEGGHQSTAFTERSLGLRSLLVERGGSPAAEDVVLVLPREVVNTLYSWTGGIPPASYGDSETEGAVAS
jgi:hypothetical protein